MPVTEPVFRLSYLSPSGITRGFSKVQRIIASCIQAGERLPGDASKVHDTWRYHVVSHGECGVKPGRNKTMAPSLDRSNVPVCVFTTSFKASHLPRQARRGTRKECFVLLTSFIDDMESLTCLLVHGDRIVLLSWETSFCHGFIASHQLGAHQKCLGSSTRSGQHCSTAQVCKLDVLPRSHRRMQISRHQRYTHHIAARRPCGN